MITMAKCAIDKCAPSIALTVVTTNCIDTNIITASITQSHITLIHIYRKDNTQSHRKLLPFAKHNYSYEQNLYILYKSV